jgi:hypothetical protein
MFNHLRQCLCGNYNKHPYKYMKGPQKEMPFKKKSSLKGDNIYNVINCTLMYGCVHIETMFLT